MPRKSLPRVQKPDLEGELTEPQSSEVSRHLLRVQEEERKRISHELHDGTGQGLMVLRLYLGMLGNEAAGPEAQERVREALNLLDRTIEDLRRIIRRLSPRNLEEMGLLAAVRKEAREVSKNSGIEARFDLPKDIGSIDDETEVALYRSVQEALHNIARHSKARSFRLQIEREAGMIRLMVEDDGVGFPGRPTSRRKTFGLLGMRDRVAALGGNVRIRSRQGKGTRILIALPVAGIESESPSNDDVNRPPAQAGPAEGKLERRAASAAGWGSKANSHNSHNSHGH